jgi:hypothetical protein
VVRGARRRAQQQRRVGAHAAARTCTCPLKSVQSCILSGCFDF